MLKHMASEDVQSSLLEGFNLPSASSPIGVNRLKASDSSALHLAYVLNPRHELFRYEQCSKKTVDSKHQIERNRAARISRKG